MIPLWATAMFPVQSTCGCAFASLGSPWVAQRVCPMPTVPRSRFGSAASSCAILPTALCTLSPLRATTATPAES